MADKMDDHSKNASNRVREMEQAFKTEQAPRITAEEELRNL